MQLSKLSQRLVLLLVVASVASSCSFIKKKPEKSNTTGWNYNDKNYGNFNVTKPKDIKTAPGLVFVQGGTFTMGQLPKISWAIGQRSPSCNG